MKLCIYVCTTLVSDPFTLLRKGSTIQYFLILFDPFRSNPIKSLSCIFRTCESERFISNEIARSHKNVILLRNANFSFKKAVCLWKITEWKIYFIIFKKILLSFVQKWSRKISDPITIHQPWPNLIVQEAIILTQPVHRVLLMENLRHVYVIVF